MASVPLGRAATVEVLDVVEEVGIAEVAAELVELVSGTGTQLLDEAILSGVPVFD